jgi:hypothetical protein
MRFICSNSFTVTNPYARVEEPFYLPSEKRKQRHNEMETRRKNRRKRKKRK